MKWVYDLLQYDDIPYGSKYLESVWVCFWRVGSPFSGGVWIHMDTTMSNDNNDKYKSKIKEVNNKNSNSNIRHDHDDDDDDDHDHYHVV